MATASAGAGPSKTAPTLSAVDALLSAGDNELRESKAGMARVAFQSALAKAESLGSVEGGFLALERLASAHLHDGNDAIAQQMLNSAIVLLSNPVKWRAAVVAPAHAATDSGAVSPQLLRSRDGLRLLLRMIFEERASKLAKSLGIRETKATKKKPPLVHRQKQSVNETALDAPALEAHTHADEIHAVRDAARAMLDSDLSVLRVLEYVSRIYKTLLESLCDACVAALAPPPCAFAIVALDLFGADEMYPFSRLSIGILYRIPAHRPYFDALRALLTLAVLNVRETPAFIWAKGTRSLLGRGFRLADSALDPEEAIAVCATPSEAAEAAAASIGSAGLGSFTASLVCGAESLLSEYQAGLQSRLSVDARIPSGLLGQVGAWLDSHSETAAEGAGGKGCVRTHMAALLALLRGAVRLFYFTALRRTPPPSAADEPAHNSMSLQRMLATLTRLGCLGADLAAELTAAWTAGARLMVRAQLAAGSDADLVAWGGGGSGGSGGGGGGGGVGPAAGAQSDAARPCAVADAEPELSLGDGESEAVLALHRALVLCRNQLRAAAARLCGRAAADATSDDLAAALDAVTLRHCVAAATERSLVVEGEALFRSGAVASAATCLRAAVEAATTAEERLCAAVWSARVCSTQGQHAAAIAALGAEPAVDGASGEAAELAVGWHAVAAVAQCGQGDAEAAMGHWRLAIKATAECWPEGARRMAPLFCGMGRCHAALGQHAAACALFDEAATVGSPSVRVQALALRSEALAAAGDLAGAQAALATSRDLAMSLFGRGHARTAALAAAAARAASASGDHVAAAAGWDTVRLVGGLGTRQPLLWLLRTLFAQARAEIAAGALTAAREALESALAVAVADAPAPEPGPVPEPTTPTTPSTPSTPGGAFSLASEPDSPVSWSIAAPPDTEAVAAAMGSIGVVCLMQGNVVASIRWLTEAVEMRARLFGNSSPALVLQLRSLESAFAAAGDTRNAIAMADKTASVLFCNDALHPMPLRPGRTTAPFQRQPTTARVSVYRRSSISNGSGSSSAGSEWRPETQTVEFADFAPGTTAQYQVPAPVTLVRPAVPDSPRDRAAAFID